MKKFSFLSSLETHLKTVNQIYDAVKITLGPTGKNGIALTKGSELKFLTSGSLLLKNLEFDQSSANVLLKLFEQASLKTFQVSGDGSTTTTLLSAEILKISFKFLLNGYNPIFLSNGLKKLGYFLVEKVNQYSQPIEFLSHFQGIFQTSLGKKIHPDLLNCFDKVFPNIRRDGLILVEENLSAQNEVEIVEGIQLERGFASSYFVNDLKSFEVNYENPYILITSQPLESFQQIEPIIQYVKDNQKPLVIVAEEIKKELLSTLILNHIQKKLKVVVIKYTAIKFLKTGILEDLATLTYSTYFVPTSKKEIQPFQIEDLGQAERVIIQKEKSTFLLSKFSKVIAQRRMNELNRELLTCESEDEKSLFQTRIARLSGNILKIKIGISNQYEMMEQRQKIESSLLTLRSSLEEGFLPGGGCFYLGVRSEMFNWAALNLIGEEIFASNIVAEALLSPFQELFQNNNLPFWHIFQEIGKNPYGTRYDLIEKKFFFQNDPQLIDSAKAIRSLCWNSLSLLSTILTSE